MNKYLPSISESDENQYDFNSFKTSKFLFHLFNKFQEVNGRSKQTIRHTKLSDDNYALGEIQDRNWPYFIDKIIEYSQGFLNLSDVEKDLTELNILRNTRDNFEILKGLYNELLNAVAISLHAYLKEISYLKKKKIDTDLRNNNFEIFDPQNTHIQNNILQTYIDFFYTTGRFPGNQRLISIPRGGRIPSFINAEDVISPRYLYERYLSRDMSGLIAVQFLAALNKYLAGDKEISRNAMSEFFHNLSWQALAADNDGVLLQFEGIGELVHSINSRLRSEINREKADAIKTGINFRSIINDNFPEENTTVQQDNENLLVDDIINGETTDFRTPFPIPIPKTEDEITDSIRQDNINFLKGELAKNARDFEIAAEIEAQKQADLLRNILDPGLGLITNEGTSSLDAIRIDNGDSVIPQLDPIALRGMEGLLNNLKETIELSDDEDGDNDVKPPPEVFYPPLIVPQPNLQDILTNDNQNADILNDIRSIRDTINTEVGEITTPPPPDDFPGDFDDTEFYPPPPPVNPFANATAPTLEDDPLPYTYPTAPPYDDNLPPNYDDLFPTEPVVIRQVPISDESSDDENTHPPPPDPRLIYTLVPPEINVDDVNDPANLIGNPNINVILPPIEGNFPPLANPFLASDNEEIEDLGYTDDDIDFVITPADQNITTGSLLYNKRRNEIYRKNAKRRALNILAKKRKIKNTVTKEKAKNKIIPEFNNDNIIIDGEGEVQITNPENAQIDYDMDSVVPYYNEIIQLPNQDTHMSDIRTKNLILKRKHPEEGMLVKKYISGTDITNRNIWNVSAPINDIIHVDEYEDDTIEISDDSDIDEIIDVKPYINQSGLATVDIHTMKKMPWIDFNIILTESDPEKREQVIIDLLQNNMPHDNDQYYIYHDQESNTFSVELDEDADEIRDLVERARVIDARLKIEYMTAKERKNLKTQKKKLLTFLEEYYGLKTPPRVMADKKTNQEIIDLEDDVIEVEKQLNSAGDNFFHIYNPETQEYEIRKDNPQASAIAQKITDAILRTDDRLRTATSEQQIRGLRKVRKSLILYLKLVGMTELAESLDE